MSSIKVVFRDVTKMNVDISKVGEKGLDNLLED